MGKRGPKPTPTSTLARRGSWRAGEREGEPQPEVVAEPPPCPAHVKGDARKAWNRLAPQLVGCRLLAEADLGTFERYCRTYAAWQKVMRAVESGEVVDGGEVRSLHRLDEMLRRLEASFGLNPADRANLKIPEPKKTDGKARFFKPRLVA